jgi:RNA polymerase primary sigma factor
MMAAFSKGRMVGAPPTRYSPNWAPKVDRSGRSPGRRQLTEAEELERVRRIGDGDMSARNELVLAYRRIVIKLAYRYRSTLDSLDLDDHIAEGDLGLIRAATKYKPIPGRRFWTYARFWIRRQVIRALPYADPIRLTPFAIKLIVARQRIETELTATLGRKPTEEDIVDKLPGKPGAWGEMVAIKRAKGCMSLNQAPASGKQVDDVEIVANHPDRKADVADPDLRVDVVVAIEESLTAHAAEVVRLRFGFNWRGPNTLREVGTALGVSAHGALPFGKGRSQLRGPVGDRMVSSPSAAILLQVLPVLLQCGYNHPDERLGRNLV